MAHFSIKKKKKKKKMSVCADGSEVAASEAPRHDAGGADAAAAADDDRTRPKKKRPQADVTNTWPLKPEARRVVREALAAVKARPTGAFTSTAADWRGALQRGVQLRQMAVESMNLVSECIERLVDMLASGQMSREDEDHARQALDTLSPNRFEGQSEAGRQAAANSLSRVSVCLLALA
jgi:hypothetical protein